jgi:acyl-CoA thioester hydrolase
VVKPFICYLRVRYSECDAQKVVFNSRYGDYVDVAVNEFLRALGYASQLVSGELDFQLVKQTTEWRGPARFDQVLAASVFASRIGSTSFTFTTEFRIAGDDRVICTVETVYVMVDTHTLTKKPIPSRYPRRVRAGAPGVVTNHAGNLRI